MFGEEAAISPGNANLENAHAMESPNTQPVATQSSDPGRATTAFRSNTATPGVVTPLHPSKTAHDENY